MKSNATLLMRTSIRVIAGIVVGFALALVFIHFELLPGDFYSYTLADVIELVIIGFVSIWLSSYLTKRQTTDARRVQFILELLDKIRINVDSSDSRMKQYLANGGEEERKDILLLLKSTRNKVGLLEKFPEIKRQASKFQYDRLVSSFDKLRTLMTGDHWNTKSSFSENDSLAIKRVDARAIRRVVANIQNEIDEIQIGVVVEE